MKFDFLDFLKNNRMTIQYNSKHAMGFKIRKAIQLPSRPSTLYNQILDSFGIKNVLKKDEMGIIKSYENLNLPYAKVLVIGAGDGVSIIYNSINNPNNFHLTIIEESSEQLKLVQNNLRLNNLNVEHDYVHGFAGDRYLVYGNEVYNSNNLIDINDYDFDLLELDCEGSELQIISSLKSKPKFIIVEVHPNLNSITYVDFLSIIAEKEYSIIKAYTVNGNEVELYDISFFFEKPIVSKLLKRPHGDLLLVLTLKRSN